MVFSTPTVQSFSRSRSPYNVYPLCVLCRCQKTHSVLQSWFAAYVVRLPDTPGWWGIKGPAPRRAWHSVAHRRTLHDVTPRRGALHTVTRGLGLVGSSHRRWDNLIPLGCWLPVVVGWHVLGWDGLGRVSRTRLGGHHHDPS